MAAKPEIWFRMAKLNQLCTPAGWARFIDDLYGGERRNSVKEIVRLTIESAVEAGYRAGRDAGAAEVDGLAEVYEVPRHRLETPEVRQILTGLGVMIRRLRPPAPEPVPDEQGKNDDQG